MSLGSTNQNTILEPHLSDTLRGSDRYPNPFFDLAQQYTPRTVKELFKWCTYFFYSNPLVGATITKISRYPITKLIIEEPDAQVKNLWDNIFNDVIKIKDRLMETNLDLNVYGNAFVSVHLPFTRYLICTSCANRESIQDLAWTWKSYNFNWICPKCGNHSVAKTDSSEHIKDVPYRAKEAIRVIRWNPEHIAIRYNEATAESHYFYNVSPSLRFQIKSGEKEIIETLPLLFLQAVKKSRLIKLSPKNLFHLKRPTLAEKDMGWGKPLIQHVMKDLYYMATLRKAQEAIAQEHIVPFDFLFPQPNAQMDPFVHADLGNWKSRVEEIIKNRRRDPNYKAVMPVPIGFGRIGGNGKALMLTPELNYLNQTIVGGMGIPEEFLFGGLNWTGSSITLRSLQNDFQHNQTQLLDLTIFLKDRIRTFLKVPDAKKLRFMDFKMADDIQRIQQFISLNSQRKISDETLLTELGLDYQKEVKKILSEIQIQNEIQDMMARSQAKTSGEAQIISMNYQQKMQEIQKKALEKENYNNALNYGGPQQGSPFSGEQSNLVPQQGIPQQGEEALGTLSSQGAGSAAPQQEMIPPQGQGESPSMDIPKTIASWASKLSKMDPTTRMTTLTRIKQQMPTFGKMVEDQMNQAMSAQNSGAGGGAAGQSNPNALETNMTAMPEKGAPTRAGSA